MNAIKYYGCFRGAATMPLAAFAVGPDANDYAGRKGLIVKECYMNCGFRCPTCGNLTAAPDALPCDDCELSDGCVFQPFTPECEEAYSHVD